MAADCFFIRHVFFGVLVRGAGAGGEEEDDWWFGGLAGQAGPPEPRPRVQYWAWHSTLANDTQIPAALIDFIDRILLANVKL